MKNCKNWNSTDIHILYIVRLHRTIPFGVHVHNTYAQKEGGRVHMKAYTYYKILYFPYQRCAFRGREGPRIMNFCVRTLWVAPLLGCNARTDQPTGVKWAFIFGLQIQRKMDSEYNKWHKLYTNGITNIRPNVGLTWRYTGGQCIPNKIDRDILWIKRTRLKSMDLLNTYTIISYQNAYFKYLT